MRPQPGHDRSPDERPAHDHLGDRDDKHLREGVDQHDRITALDEQALEMGLARFERMMNPPIPAALQQQLGEEFEKQVRAKQARKAQLEEGDEDNGDDR